MPSIAVFDGFTRANSASLGANWLDSVAGNWTISSNTALGVVSGGSYVWWNANLFNADQDVSITCVDNVDGVHFQSILCRGQAADAGQNLYLALLDGSPHLRSGPVVAGSVTWILVGATAAGNGSVIRQNITGNIIHISVDGADQGSYTDSTFATGSYTGFEASNGCKMDNFFSRNAIPNSGAYDSFTDADGTLLTAHTPDSGSGAYVALGGGVSSSTQIQSNTATGQVSSSGEYVKLNVTPASADYTVQADATWLTPATGNDFAGIVGRVDSSGNCYQFYYYLADSLWHLGAPSGSLGTYSDGGLLTPAGGPVNIALEMIGTSIKAYINGIAVISATDSGLTAAGNAGLFTRNSQSGTDLHLDNWAASIGAPVALVGTLGEYDPEMVLSGWFDDTQSNLLAGWFDEDLIGPDSTTQTATAGVATVTVSGVAPASSGTGTGTATPGVATVTVSGVAPASHGTGSVTGTPGIGTVTVSGIAPAGTATGSVTETPGFATVTVSGNAPASSGTGTGTATPGASTVTVSGISPASSGTGTGTATPGFSTVTVSGVAPLATPTGHATATPGFSTVTVSGIAPAASGSGTGTSTPGVAVITTTGIAPAGSASGSVTETPGVATVTISGATPSASGSGTGTATPGFALVNVNGISPAASGGGVVASPGSAAVAIAGVSPAAAGLGVVSVAPGSASVTVSATAPISGPSGAVTALPGIAGVSVSGSAPIAAGTGLAGAVVGVATVNVSVAVPLVSAVGSVTGTAGIATVSISVPAPQALPLSVTVTPGVANIAITATEGIVTPTATIVIPGVATVSIVAVGVTGNLVVAPNPIVVSCQVRGPLSIPGIARGPVSMTSKINGAIVVESLL